MKKQQTVERTLDLGKIRDQVAQGLMDRMWWRNRKGLSDAPPADAVIVSVEPVGEAPDMEAYEDGLPEWMQDDEPAEPAKMPEWLQTLIDQGEISLPESQISNQPADLSWLREFSPEDQTETIEEEDDLPPFLRGRRVRPIRPVEETDPLARLIGDLGLSQEPELHQGGGMPIKLRQISCEDWRVEPGSAKQYLECAKRHNIWPAEAAAAKPRPGQSAVDFVQYLVEKKHFDDVPRTFDIYDLLVKDGEVVNPDAQVRPAQTPIFEPPTLPEDTKPTGPIRSSQFDDLLIVGGDESPVVGRRVPHWGIGDLPDDGLSRPWWDDDDFEDDEDIVVAAPVEGDPIFDTSPVMPVVEKRKVRPASAGSGCVRFAVIGIFIILLVLCGGAAWFVISINNSMNVRTPGVDYSQWNDARATQTAGAPATETREAAREATSMFVGTQQTELTLTPAATVEQPQNLPTIVPTICATQQVDNSVIFGCTSGEAPASLPTATLQPLG